MGRKSVIILPQTNQILMTIGEQIKLTRLRRKLSSKLVSQHVGISRATL